ncbi:hypothetical protein [Patulibacter defluvii]|uniref:hypothetical protein n=1 Tax=Patulibacter defluvii TaxID=3095358 RepID=UPI002A75DFFC|nr:hypothetical protein [Patulibacter sp. DM4]
MTDPSVELVATVGPLDHTIALLRELLHVARANQAIAVMAPGAGRHDLVEPAIVDVERLNPIEVTIGERVVHLPHAIELGDDHDPVVVPPLPEFKPLPPFDADPETGDVAAPLGGVEHYVAATREAAALLGGPDDVLQLRWDTARPDVDFSVTVRADDREPVVLGVGDETFPMPPGWPEVVTTNLTDREG